MAPVTLGANGSQQKGTYKLLQGGLGREGVDRANFCWGLFFDRFLDLG